MSPTQPETATYPPQSSLHAALQNRQAMDSTVTVQLDEAQQNQQGQQGQQCVHHHSEEEKEAMRLRGGCFDLGLCGCPDCECCIIPCTIM
ncbi:hypothetical protein JCM10207_007356 [Rhodosporidiobolus poonsookiae]